MLIELFNNFTVGIVSAFSFEACICLIGKHKQLDHFDREVTNFFHPQYNEAFLEKTGTVYVASETEYNNEI